MADACISCALQAPNEDALCYRELYDEWRERFNVVVQTSTRDSFQDMFDDDDTLAYEPNTTAAVVLCGGDEEAEAAALQVTTRRPPGAALAVRELKLIHVHTCRVSA